MRKVFGPAAVTVIIGAIAMVFVFFGVYNPRTTKGQGQGALAATVNGDAITMTEFGREYQQRTEMFSNMMKGKIDPNMLKQLRIGEQVVEDLIRRRLVLQEAQRMGMTAPDAEVREKIKEMPYFKAKDGSFDVSRYNQLLAANHYTPAAFEDMIREDILRARVSEFVRGRAKVSEKEVESDFLSQEDRRQVDYVVLDGETAKKFVIVGDKDVEDALKDKAGLDAAKMHYERTKMSYVKPTAKKTVKKGEAAPKTEFLPFEEVKKKVVLDMLREKRSDEGHKANKELSADLYAKAKELPRDKFKAYVKGKGLEMKTSAKFNRLQNSVPGLGDLPELVSDAFKDGSPLVQGPKLYEGAKTFAVAMDLKAFKPDMAEFAKSKTQLEQTASSRKSEEMFQQWMHDLRTRAKVSINQQIGNPTDADAEAPAPVPVDD
ncbi:MAG: SurA N-terminal domain-containing protein [Deltaproteobacteria bacterium]|nr:SurA N-terminal domain-containing protein [Deltaproteobacteria bacterium]